MLLGAAVLSACSAKKETASEVPERIVVLTAADCEIVYALGAGDRVVGRGAYCDRPEETAGIPAVESGYETNVEQIIALKPDLVLMGVMNQRDAVVTQLENAGIRTHRSKADSIEETYASIRTIAGLLGKDAPENAEKLISQMQDAFEQIRKAPVGTGDKTVYFEVSPLEYGLWTAGRGTFMDEAASLMGLTNIFSDVEGWAEISEEQVLSRTPDYIVTISMYYGEGPTPVEEILGRTGWENVTAVQKKAILNLDDDSLSRPCPRLSEGVQKLYGFAKEYE